MISMEVDLFLGGWTTLMVFRAQNWLNYISNVFMIALVVTYGWFIFMILKSLKNYLSPKINKKLTFFQEDLYLKYNKNFLGVYEGYDLTKRAGPIHLAIITVKDMVFPFVLIYGVSHPFYQLTPMILIHLLLLIYVACTRPFSTKKENVLQIFNLAMYLIGICMFFGLYFLQGIISEE